MDINRPEPRLGFHTGTPVAARLAATVIVLRDGPDGPEVLLVQRTDSASFMGGAWVFPGGSVDPEDGTGEPSVHKAAIRELAEETALRLEPDGELLVFARWITPESVRIRFDTWFFLAPAPPDSQVSVDGGEIVDYRWISPAAALQLRRQEQLFMVFPTIKQLERISGFRTVEELLSQTRGRVVEPITPRITGSGEAARILLPGDAGYED